MPGAVYRVTRPGQQIAPGTLEDRDCRARTAYDAPPIVAEPIVANNACIMPQPGYLQALRDECTRRGIVLIFDEIYTGLYRMGARFACDHWNVRPDLLCLGKALTGGSIGMAATVARPHVFEAFWSDDPGKALSHGPTFMANPLACAAALASLDLFDSADRLGQIDMIDAVLSEELEPCRSLPGIVDVRVKGAIGVVQLSQPGDLAVLGQGFVDRGVWARPFGDILYLTPPFITSRSDLAILGQAMRGVAGDWSARHGDKKPAGAARPKALRGA